jgi:DNA-binding NarL/FixJ family response regulator
LLSKWESGEKLKKIRVLIVDDHTLFRDGLKALLLTAGEFELVAEASSGEEALAAVRTLEIDVVLLDIKMPGLNGIEATREMVRLKPKIHILVVTMLDDDASVLAVMQAGARGYVLKGVTHEELLRALRAVAGGEAIFSPAIAERMTKYFSKLPPPYAPPPFPELTEREREVLRLLAQGASNQEIALRLELQSKTVRNHISNILAKLQVSDRKEAARKANERGLS